MGMTINENIDPAGSGGAEFSDNTAPLYQRVKNWIRHKIDSGEWSPGEKIASENDLVRQFGVSRMTVHRSLRELVMEQRLKRVPGVGTFVAERRIPVPLLELRSISEEIEARGGRHRSRTLLHRREIAGAETAGVLPEMVGTPVFHTVMVHYDGDVPVQIEDRLVNPRAVPGYLDQDFGAETPNQYLVRISPFTEAEHVVEAATSDPAQRELLALDEHEPVLILRRQTWNRNELVTSVTFIHPAARFRFSGRFRPDGRGG